MFEQPLKDRAYNSNKTNTENYLNQCAQ